MSYFEAILDQAHTAARNAVVNCKDNSYGCNCGFAWVTISGTIPLARHCRLRSLDQGASCRYGSKGYPRGWTWWKPGGYSGQDVSQHEKAALAFRAVLAEHGICCEVGSRLD